MRSSFRTLGKDTSYHHDSAGCDPPNLQISSVFFHSVCTTCRIQPILISIVPKSKSYRFLDVSSCISLLCLPDIIILIYDKIEMNQNYLKKTSSYSYQEVKKRCLEMKVGLNE